jgi:hypothetical protein
VSDQQEKSQSEIDRTVAITAEDCNAALDFWRHFNIPISTELQNAMDSFSRDPSFENQQKVKFYVCKAIVETDHPAFKDEMFSKIAEECENVSFHMQFDNELESILTEKE